MRKPSTAAWTQIPNADLDRFQESAACLAKSSTSWASPRPSWLDAGCMLQEGICCGNARRPSARRTPVHEASQSLCRARDATPSVASFAVFCGPRSGSVAYSNLSRMHAVLRYDKCTKQQRGSDRVEVQLCRQALTSLRALCRGRVWQGSLPIWQKSLFEMLQGQTAANTSSQAHGALRPRPFTYSALQLPNSERGSLCHIKTYRLGSQKPLNMAPEKCVGLPKQGYKPKVPNFKPLSLTPTRIYGLGSRSWRGHPDLDGAPSSAATCRSRPAPHRSSLCRSHRMAPRRPIKDVGPVWAVVVH